MQKLRAAASSAQVLGVRKLNAQSWLLADSPEAAAVEPELADLELKTDDIKLRESLKRQRAIIDAIFMYTDAVPAAFDALVKAHEKLAEAGILVHDDAPDSVPLLDRLAEATNHITEVANSARRRFKTMRGTVQACCEEVYRADGALAEVRRYSQKLDSLTSEDFQCHERNIGVGTLLGRLGGKTGKPQKEDVLVIASAKIMRNREKLQRWADEAGVRQACARDMLHACMSRQEPLLDSVRDVVRSVVHAIGAASGCRPVVDNVLSDLPVVALDAPLVLTFSITPQLTRLPSLTQPFESATAEKVPLVLPLSEAAPPTSSVATGTLAIEKLLPLRGTKISAELKVTKLADELEAYGEGAKHLAKTEAEYGDEPSSVEELTTVGDTSCDNSCDMSWQVPPECFVPRPSQMETLFSCRQNPAVAEEAEILSPGGVKYIAAVTAFGARFARAPLPDIAHTLQLPIAGEIHL